MDQGMIMDTSNSKGNNRNISNSTSKSMDRERVWMPVTAGPATIRKHLQEHGRKQQQEKGKNSLKKELLVRLRENK